TDKAANDRKDTAECLKVGDEVGQEQRRRIAELLEQLGRTFNADTAEPRKKFLQTMHNQNCAETSAQQQFGVRRKRLVDFPRPRNIKTRLGAHGSPSSSCVSLARFLIECTPS